MKSVFIVVYYEIENNKKGVFTLEETYNYEVLESCVRNTYARVVWTQKIQDKQADIYSFRYNTMEVLRIISTSLTSAGLLVLIFTDPFLLKLISAIISFVSLLISAIFKSFNLQSMSSSNKGAANKFIKVRDNLEGLLLKIKMKSYPVEDLMHIYDDLSTEYDELCNDAPITTTKAVKLATKALKISEDNNFTDNEIDSFLPKELRKEA